MEKSKRIGAENAECFVLSQTDKDRVEHIHLVLRVHLVLRDFEEGMYKEIHLRGVTLDYVQYGMEVLKWRKLLSEILGRVLFD